MVSPVQSDPYRCGQATLPGYTPPADRPTTPSAPNVSSPNLNGALSPQTIAQSARNGVPISGRVPTDQLKILYAGLGRASVDLYTKSGGSGTARLFLWTGAIGAIPVFTTSCSPTADPPPVQQIDRGTQRISIPITAAQHAQLAKDSRLLLSYETADDQVQAFDIRLG